MTITTELLDEIEAGCEGATPGPWRLECWGDGSSPPGLANVVADAAEVVLVAEIPEDDAAYIARLDPATVRELVRLARIGMEVEDASKDMNLDWADATLTKGSGNE
jgi:hypothetical protein